MKRHRWLKLREHVRICVKCGTGRESWFDPQTEQWVVTWHRADGESQHLGMTPPCEAGVRTAAALNKYAVEIAESKGEKVVLK